MIVKGESLLSRWEEYRDLRLEALQAIPQAFLDDVDYAQSLSAKAWQQKMNSMFFEEVDGKFVGMIGAYREDKMKIHHIMHVVSFYVQPNHRGIGIGKSLLQCVIDLAKSDETVKKLQLGVINTQTVAHELYLSMGFKDVAYLKFAVRIQDTFFDEYLMELHLHKPSE